WCIAEIVLVGDRGLGSRQWRTNSSEHGKSKDKVECEATDSRAMGLVAPWYRREGSARVNKDQHNLANPTPESVIGELKQHGGSEFDYSTTAVESD
ncbi:hypothetical protein BHM03_00033743, partial [Ensete ventricosum]